MSDSELDSDSEDEDWQVVELFTGAGGASCGFQQAGAKPMLGVDHDDKVLKMWAKNTSARPQAVKCLKIGFEELNLPPQMLRLHYHASAPCQALSRAKTQTQRQTERAEGLRLFRLALELPLKMGYGSWSLEQVCNRHVIKIVHAFEQCLPTRVAHVVLDAADFGLPSTRSRLYIGPPELIRRLKQEPARARVSAKQAFVERGLTLPRGAVALTVSRSSKSAQNKPRMLTDVALTVCASHPMTILDKDGGSLGCLKPDHSAALMGFPRDWELPKASRARQAAVGNAVPPLMSKMIMRSAMHVNARLPTPVPEAALRAIMVATESPEGPERSSTRDGQLLRDELLAEVDGAIETLRRIRQKLCT